MQAAQPIDPAADAAAHERALVEGVLAGMPGAFERLVRDHQGLCWHVIQRMVRHPEDTRELCQEAFLRVHRHLHQYRFDAPLKSWIAQVAYSVALRHLERRRIPLARSEEHTSELQSLMRISYAVFCLKKKNETQHK